MSSLEKRFREFIREISIFLHREMVIDNIKRIIFKGGNARVFDRSSMVINNSRDYGVYYENDQMYITVSDSSILDCILRREAFKLFIPRSIASLEESKDFAWEYARLKASKNVAKKWLKLWKKVAEKKIIGVNVYDPTVSFPVFDTLTKGDFLVDMMIKFYQYDKYDIKIREGEYYSILDEYMFTYKYPFDALDLKIMDLFYKNPTISVDEITKKMNIKYAKISRKIKKLKNNQIVVVKRFILLRNIGFRNYSLVVIGIPIKDFLESVVKNPFLYSVIPFYDGIGGVTASFAVPINKDNIMFIERYMKRYEEEYITYTIRQDKLLQNYNFHIYDVDQKRWVIPWDAWSKWVIGIYNDKSYDLFVDESDLITRSTINLERLDKTDIRILNKLFYSFKPVREIRDSLKINMNVLLERIRKLEKMNIIKHRVAFNLLGLDETIILYCEGSKDIIFTIIHGLNDLPRHDTIFEQDLDKSKFKLFSYISLPRGDVIMFLKTFYENFSHKLDNLDLHISGPTYGGYFKFPVNCWDDENKRWKRHPDIKKDKHLLCWS